MSSIDDINRDFYIGGEAEFWDELLDCVFRGPIDNIIIEGNNLKIIFSWMARGEGFPLPYRWTKCDEYERSIIIDLYDIDNIGPGFRGGNRILLSSRVLGKDVILFPYNGSKLDPTRVEDLFLEEETTHAA